MCQLPEDIGNLKSLVTLTCYCNIVIWKLPASVVHLSNLKELNLELCKGLQLPNSLSGLCSLVILDLSQCELGDGAIPDDIVSLSSLKELRLDNNNFVSIPESIFQLSQLTLLSINRCRRLRYLPEHLPFGLEIEAQDCKLLARYLPIYNTGEGRTVSFMIYDGEEFCYELKEEVKDEVEGKIQGNIALGCIIIVIWPLSEIPMGCESRESRVKTEFSTFTSASDMDGYALRVVYEVLGLDDGYSTFIESTHVRKDFICYFETNQGPFEHRLEFDIWTSKRAGFYEFLIYIPIDWFDGQLNGASFLQASVHSKDGSHVIVKACNARLMPNKFDDDYFYNLRLDPGSFTMSNSLCPISCSIFNKDI